MDHFAQLGLPRRYAIDRDDLEDAYLRLVAEHHPDRFVGADATTQAAAMRRSTEINEAYRVLRDPVMRAEYLVVLGGIDLRSSDPESGAPQPDQAFLLEMLERRDAIEDGDSDPESEIARLEEECDEVLDRAIDALEADDIAVAAHWLVRLRYLRRFEGELADQNEAP